MPRSRPGHGPCTRRLKATPFRRVLPAPGGGYMHVTKGRYHDEIPAAAPPLALLSYAEIRAAQRRQQAAQRAQERAERNQPRASVPGRLRRAQARTATA